MRRTITETDNGRNFLFIKFSVVDFFLIVKRNIFMYTAKIGLWQISQLSIFVFSRKKYHYLGQVRNFRFLFSYFVLLPPLGILNDSVCYEYDFFCAAINPIKSRQATLYRERSTLCHSFINLTQQIGDIKHM